MSLTANNQPADAAYEELINAQIVRHTVNFTYEYPTHITAGGSGVLAFLGSVRGILTCSHVLRAIRTHEVEPGKGLLGIGINGVRNTELQAIKMTFDEIRQCSAVLIGDRDDPMGPDLGFVRLPANVWNALAAIGSPLDLQPQISLNAQLPPSEAHEFMVLATGVPHALIGERVNVHGIDAVSLGTGVFPGVLHREQPNGVYDRIRLEPRGGRNYPKTYEGVSGGGIWGIAFRKEGTALSVVQRRLMGIAYFETAPDANGERQLIGHGPHSLYEQLIPKIRTLENDPMP